MSCVIIHFQPDYGRDAQMGTHLRNSIRWDVTVRRDDLGCVRSIEWQVKAERKRIVEPRRERDRVIEITPRPHMISPRR